MGLGTNILKNVEAAYAKLGRDINPVGQFNLKLQLLVRILFMQVFLAQLFKESDEAKLECDVKNIGCQDVCKNRFMPVSHWRFWHIELYAWMLSIFIMLVLRYVVDKAAATVNLDEDQKLRRSKSVIQAGEYLKKKSEEFDGQFTPRSIRLGYLITLIVRLVFEYYCLIIEKELNRNQSQKSGFWEGLSLEEKWMCYVDGDRDNDLPQANRSMFWHGEENLACTNSDTSVPCWIWKSRMKSWGLKLMYIALMLNFAMTFLELVWHFIFGLRSKSKSNKEN